MPQRVRPTLSTQRQLTNGDEKAVEAALAKALPWLEAADASAAQAWLAASPSDPSDDAAKCARTEDEGTEPADDGVRSITAFARVEEARKAALGAGVPDTHWLHWLLERSLALLALRAAIAGVQSEPRLPGVCVNAAAVLPRRLTDADEGAACCSRLLRHALARLPASSPPLQLPHSCAACARVSRRGPTHRVSMACWCAA